MTARPLIVYTGLTGMPWPAYLHGTAGLGILLGPGKPYKDWPWCQEKNTDAPVSRWKETGGGMEMAVGGGGGGNGEGGGLP